MTEKQKKAEEQSARVQDIFTDCLFQAEEIEEGTQPEGAVRVEGLMCNFGFHPARLERHRGEIVELIEEIVTDEYLPSGGGGMSFLNLCQNRDGELWTGLHQVMEQFTVLCIAIGHARFVMPRAFWGMFPGNMPYITFNTKPLETEEENENLRT